MPSTLALIKKEQPKKPEESALHYLDRTRADAYWKLQAKKKKTKGEDEEFKALESKAQDKLSGAFLRSDRRTAYSFS